MSMMKTLSGTLRSVGHAFETVGASMEQFSYTERLVRSTKCLAHNGKTPSGSPSFVASTASIIGNVKLGAGSSIWYGATIRGDVNHVKIGANTNIQDRAVVHVAKFTGDHPTVIGDNVTIGPNCTIHACTLEDDCMVGIGASVLDGAVVKKNSIVAPGSVVTPGTVVGSGQLWAGVPAKMLRSLTEDDIEFIKSTADETQELSTMHAVESSKDLEEIEADKEAYKDQQERNPLYLDPKRIPEILKNDDRPGVIFNRG